MTRTAGLERLDVVDRTVVLLGRELRRLRKERGWTREVMCQRLTEVTGQQISLPTLGSYEQGTREVTARRLVALCTTLGIRPVEVWVTLDKQVYEPFRAGAIRVHLRRVAALPGDDLEPARAWARTQLHLGISTATLSVDALTSLAEVCGLDAIDVVAALRRTTIPTSRAAAADPADGRGEDHA